MDIVWCKPYMKFDNQCYQYHVLFINTTKYEYNGKIAMYAIVAMETSHCLYNILLRREGHEFTQLSDLYTLSRHTRHTFLTG